MHIHVLMLCRKFELIPIKIRFFMIFQSWSKSHVHVPIAVCACQLMKLAHLACFVEEIKQRGRKRDKGREKERRESVCAPYFTKQ